MSNFIIDPYWFVVAGTTQEQLTHDDSRNLYQASQGGVGMCINSASALGVGSKLLSYSGFVKAIGSPTGTLYCRVYNVSGSILAQATTTYDVSTISDADYEEKEFTFDGSFTIASGNFILLWYVEGDGSNFLTTWFRNADVYDGTDSVLGYHHGGVFSTNTGDDATMKITYN